MILSQAEDKGKVELEFTSGEKSVERKILYIDWEYYRIPENYTKQYMRKIDSAQVASVCIQHRGKTVVANISIVKGVAGLICGLAIAAALQNLSL